VVEGGRDVNDEEAANVLSGYLNEQAQKATRQRYTLDEEFLTKAMVNSHGKAGAEKYRSLLLEYPFLRSVGGFVQIIDEAVKCYVEEILEKTQDRAWEEEGKDRARVCTCKHPKGWHAMNGGACNTRTPRGAVDGVMCACQKFLDDTPEHVPDVGNSPGAMCTCGHLQELHVHSFSESKSLFGVCTFADDNGSCPCVRFEWKP
jgi:hypothetical protein